MRNSVHKTRSVFDRYNIVGGIDFRLATQNHEVYPETQMAHFWAQ